MHSQLDGQVTGVMRVGPATSGGVVVVVITVAFVVVVETIGFVVVTGTSSGDAAVFS
jgi:hypothetical protein